MQLLKAGTTSQTITTSFSDCHSSAQDPADGSLWFIGQYGNSATKGSVWIVNVAFP